MQIRMSYLRGSSGYLLVADGTRRTTVEAALNIQRRVQEAIGSAPFVLVLNKADLTDEWELGNDIIEALQERQAKLSGQDAEAPMDDVQSLHMAVTNVSLLAHLFAALEMVVMERLPDRSFRPISTIPVWFKRFAPDVRSNQDGVQPGYLFPFLENFLVDAERLWQEHQTGRVSSGIWLEIDPLGNEYSLEASAVCLGQQRLLLIAFAQSAYEEKHAIIQRARENTLEYLRLN